MAVQGEEINRASTPMKLLEENLAETSEKTKQKKKAMENEQKHKSPFLIGSIEEINQRISKLDHKLQSYQGLVVESRMSDVDDYKLHLRPPSALGREIYQQREREAREVNQFAGIYAIKSTFTPGISNRVKNISKITMTPSKTNVKKETGKPRFVELHQFPGYDSNELTSLPNQTSAMAVLAKVADAQPTLKKKPQYRPEFERLFYSPMSQAILQDTFWWYFLEKYQSSKATQVKFFNRVSHNYVKLLIFVKNPQYRDAYLKEYPSLLSQAVYTAFCEAFPDSFRQFNAQFREDLIFLVYDWVAGMRPAPRSWLEWNLDRLEPSNIKAREEIMTQSKASGKNSLLNFDFLDSSLQTSSQSTLNPLGSQSSLSSYNTRRQSHSRRRSDPHSAMSTNTLAIEQVTEAQEGGSDTHRSSLKKNKTTRPRVGESKQDVQEPLTPIHEFEEDETTVDAQESKMSMTKSFTTLAQPPRKKIRESHPIGKGPQFVRGVFNIYGQSPLVAHFMRMQKLEPEAGMRVRLQRTEIQDLPALDAPTYRDLIQKSFKHVQNFHKDYEIMMDRNMRSASNFIHSEKSVKRQHKRRVNKLLSKPREVKRLADLLMLELKKDQDSISTGAPAAVLAALMAQE